MESKVSTQGENLIECPRSCKPLRKVLRWRQTRCCWVNLTQPAPPPGFPPHVLLKCPQEILVWVQKPCCMTNTHSQTPESPSVGPEAHSTHKRRGTWSPRTRVSIHPSCMGLMSFLGCRSSSAESRTVPGQPGWLAYHQEHLWQQVCPLYALLGVYLLHMRLKMVVFCFPPTPPPPCLARQMVEWFREF